MAPGTGLVHACSLDPSDRPTSFARGSRPITRRPPSYSCFCFKKDSGKGGITYAEALDQALCYGWIDGVRKGRDPESYTIRFTPRKPKSNWSNVNVGHVQRLRKAGRMQQPGLEAFAARSAARTGVYSFESKPTALSPDLQARFQARPAAWEFFEAQPPGYRRTLRFWIMSAKQPATRDKRLNHVIATSAAGKRIDLASPYRAV